MTTQNNTQTPSTGAMRIAMRKYGWNVDKLNDEKLDRYAAAAAQGEDALARELNEEKLTQGEGALAHAIVGRGNLGKARYAARAILVELGHRAGGMATRTYRIDDEDLLTVMIAHGWDEDMLDDKDLNRYAAAAERGEDALASAIIGGSTLGEARAAARAILADLAVES